MIMTLKFLRVQTGPITTTRCVGATAGQSCDLRSRIPPLSRAAAVVATPQEVEVNAAAQTWDLCLNKPYDDGGGENSSRVFGNAGFDMWPAMHAKTAVSGRLNDPSVNASQWTVEIAIPLAGIALNSTKTAPPADGDMWRINFSRVEWAVQIVGGRYQKFPSCQCVWSPLWHRNAK